MKLYEKVKENRKKIFDINIDYEKYEKRAKITYEGMTYFFFSKEIFKQRQDDFYQRECGDLEKRNKDFLM